MKSHLRLSSKQVIFVAVFVTFVQICLKSLSSKQLIYAEPDLLCLKKEREREKEYDLSNYFVLKVKYS